MKKRTRYISIPNWGELQHYKKKDGKPLDHPPAWIKSFTRLLHNDAYLRLSPPRRALLHALWLEYALTRTCLPLDVRLLNRRFQLAAKMADYDALNRAGFIRFVSRPSLAEGYSLYRLEGKEGEESNPRAVDEGETLGAEANGQSPDNKNIECPVCGHREFVEHRMNAHCQSAHGKSYSQVLRSAARASIPARRATEQLLGKGAA